MPREARLDEARAERVLVLEVRRRQVGGLLEDERARAEEQLQLLVAEAEELAQRGLLLGAESFDTMTLAAPGRRGAQPAGAATSTF